MSSAGVKEIHPLERHFDRTLLEPMYAGGRIQEDASRALIIFTNPNP
jgi:hypothetical protein